MIVAHAVLDPTRTQSRSQGTALCHDVERPRMYRILLPVGADVSRAQAQAEAVLDLPNAEADVFVDVLYVHEDVDVADAEWVAGGFSETYEEEMAEIRDRQRLPTAVETVGDALEDGGVEFAIHEATGEPANVILSTADERDSDAIVIGVRDRTPVGKVLFGSVTQAVVLGSDRPVTVVPAAED